MHDYEKEPLAEAWAWETPVTGGTWQTHVRAGWGKPSPDATKFNLRPLYANPDHVADAGKKIEDDGLDVAEELRSVMRYEAGRMGAVSAGILKSVIARIEASNAKVS